MKKILSIILSMVFGAFLVILFVVCNIPEHSNSIKIDGVYYKLDLPEEITQITQNRHKHDILTGYMSNDTIYIEYMFDQSKYEKTH